MGGRKKKANVGAEAVASNEPDQQAAKVVALAEAQLAQAVGDLLRIEGQVYELEGRYLSQVSRRGNIIKGYTGYLTESKITHNRAACNVARDRVFSSTSTTGWPWPGG